MTHDEIRELLTSARSSIEAVKCTPTMTLSEVQFAYLASIACSLLAMAGIMFDPKK